MASPNLRKAAAANAARAKDQENDLDVLTRGTHNDMLTLLDMRKKEPRHLAEDMANRLLDLSSLPRFINANACLTLGCSDDPNYLHYAQEALNITQLAFNDTTDKTQEAIDHKTRMLNHAQKVLDKAQEDFNGEGREKGVWFPDSEEDEDEDEEDSGDAGLKPIAEEGEQEVGDNSFYDGFSARAREAEEKGGLFRDKSPAIAEENEEDEVADSPVQANGPNGPGVPFSYAPGEKSARKKAVGMGPADKAENQQPDPTK